MSLIVLIDLDDTLLINDMNAFQKAYLPLLSQAILDLPIDQVINQILAATTAMIKKNRPGLTLEDTFDNNFYPVLGVNKSDLQAKIHHFYNDIFPGIRPLTSPNPKSVSLVNYLFDRGHHVIVATSPLFPKTATMQRLEWADLPVSKFNFDMITTYETFHFAKPNPAYYAEILYQLGCPENKAVMIGNSLQEDIIPAESLGLPTYWLNGSSDLQLNSTNNKSNSGNFDGIIPWLEKISMELPLNPVCIPEAIIPFLQAAPAAVDSFYTIYPGKHDILNHLSALLCEIDVTTNLPAIQSIKFPQGMEPFPNPINNDYIPHNIENFIRVRSKIIDCLESLHIDHWLENSVALTKTDPRIKAFEFFYSIIENDRRLIRDVFLSIHN